VLTRRRSLTAAALALATLLGTACGGSERPDPRADGALAGDDVFDWQGTDDPQVERGTITVPQRWDDPSGPSFRLAVARRFANDPAQRIGTLLVNPGGPGFGGTSLVYAADSVFSDTVLDRFDIVGWDPRGTGDSTPAVDCVDDYDRFHNSVDITPDDSVERQQIVDLAQELAAGCEQRSGDILTAVGTNDSARDIDAIRTALGEATISYFGFSYGSELGATWATLFPSTVRAAVLDGAVDPTADDIEAGLQQAQGFERTLDTFLARCSNDTTCVFHNGGKAEDAFDRLMLTIDQDPLPALADRPPLTRAAALDGVAQALYSRDQWDRLADALVAAQTGDGSALMALYDEYYQRRADGTYDNTLEAFQAISCADTPERRTVAEDDASAARFNEVAPRMAPGTTGGYFCTFFPAATDPRTAITAEGTPPIVVIGTTGDPATPLGGTQKMADTLADGRLIIVDADDHTGYTVSACARGLVDAYLVDPTGAAPGKGQRCAGD
jgi:pimeloyl-ACP methyl ester carboxylesterase